MTTQTTTTTTTAKQGEYRGILGNVRVRSRADWYQRLLWGTRDHWRARHAETLAALAIPERRVALEARCKKASGALRSLPQHDPEVIAATLGDSDVLFVRFDIKEMMDWLRVLDADLATRQIHIERARRDESEASDVS